MGTQLKKCPPRGFYPSGRAKKEQLLEDALLILSACYCGSRWINTPSYKGYNNRFETTTILLHRDQIHGDHKCKASEGERSFMLLHVAADIGPESMVRLIVSELHERQISCVRITEHWPVRPLIGQELSLATIVVVLWTDQASEAATHFYKNDKYQAFF